MSQSLNTVVLRTPYLLFLGEETSALKAKTAFGLRDWVPESCVGQMHTPGGTVELGLPELDPVAAFAAGARSLLIGVTPVGGRIPAHWAQALLAAVHAGLDIVSGLHTPLEAVPGLADAAAEAGVRLVDVRRPPAELPRATGKRRSGLRAAMVGTDCALGKKYTALALARAMRGQGVDADFRATGQTGIMIAGAGIAVDAVIADFIAGAAECISPEAAPGHWDLIEGQGSLFHPSYAGVSLGLLHGAQPDALVLCHEAGRQHMRGLPELPMPDLKHCLATNLAAARLTNPNVKAVGVALNTSRLSAEAALAACEEIGARLGLPCADPVTMGVESIVDNLLACCAS